MHARLLHQVVRVAATGVASEVATSFHTRSIDVPLIEDGGDEQSVELVRLRVIWISLARPLHELLRELGL